MQTFMTPIREPGSQPRQSLPIRSRVYVERANQKPLTREDAVAYESQVKIHSTSRVRRAEAKGANHSS